MGRACEAPRRARPGAYLLRELLELSLALAALQRVGQRLLGALELLRRVVALHLRRLRRRLVLLHRRARRRQLALQVLRAVGVFGPRPISASYDAFAFASTSAAAASTSAAAAASAAAFSWSAPSFAAAAFESASASSALTRCRPCATSAPR